MSIAGKEALAGLQLVVAVAKAGGELTPDERAVIADALDQAHLPDGITVRALIDSSYDVDTQIAQVASQDARDVAFAACITMAHANRTCLPKQQAVLDRIEKAWAVHPEKKSLIGRILLEARDTVWWVTRIDPAADREGREALVKDDVLRYSILAAALGLDPQPLVSMATDLAVVGLQTKLFRDVGRLWRRPTSAQTAANVISGLGISAGARVAVNGVMKFVPDLGNTFSASTNFAATWALGQVADHYWASGGRNDPDAAELAVLRGIFEESKAQGRRLYTQHEGDVGAKHEAHVAVIGDLVAQYRVGRITLADYERRVVELK